ncbi:hypothetical protein [Breznakiella homolactica]|uniref:Uncharacterized protein n=1 Tax=Breznakiella homolactica TaxID=2798577 RepID=A0A7T7XLM9_9SPIR|nr:hypothetical protein [Breznakiella homolactica]QQO08497.1 hypothetical protein JFL75_16400 [Breznakiella homolactica]
MHRVLFFATVMILCCTLLERQPFAVSGFLSEPFSGAVAAVHGGDALPVDPANEPVILAATTSGFISARLPMQRDIYIHRSDSEARDPAMIPSDLVKKTYNLKSIHLVPFNLRI